MVGLDGANKGPLNREVNKKAIWPDWTIHLHLQRWSWAKNKLAELVTIRKTSEKILSIRFSSYYKYSCIWTRINL